MRNLKIIQLLKSFSGEEMSEFINFAGSSYFRKDRNYSGILNGLIRIISGHKNIRDVPEEKFYNEAFGTGRVNNQTLRNRINELNRIAERYIIEKELSKDYYLSKLLLLKGYKSRKLNKQFLSEYAGVYQSAEGVPDKSIVISEILDTKVMFSKENRSFDEMFADFNRQLEYFICFFIETLFNSAKEYEIEKNYGVNPSIVLLEALLKSLKTDKLINLLEGLNKPGYRKILINYYQYKSLENIKDIKWLKKLEKLFYDNINELDDNQKNQIMTHIISYYFFRINSGEVNYLRNVFSLYKLKLKLGLHSELTEIRYPSSAFRDYVVVGTRLKKHKWVLDFIAKYSKYLPDEIREQETYSAYSKVFFSMKEYEKSLEMSNKIVSENPLYFLDASRNRLGVYYELLNFEEAFLEIDRKKHYLKNNAKKIAKPIIQYSKDYIDVYSKLLKFRLSPNKKELGYFLKSVQESGTLPLKTWFVEKIKELSNII